MVVSVLRIVYTCVMVIVSRDNKVIIKKTYQRAQDTLEDVSRAIFFVLLTCVGVVDGGRHCCCSLVLQLHLLMVEMMVVGYCHMPSQHLLAH